MAPIHRTGSVSDLRAFQTRLRPDQRRHPSWKLSNQIWDVFNESCRPVEPAVSSRSVSPSPPEFILPEASLAEQLPSAEKTWDWFSNQSRSTPRSNFHAGSVLIHDRAKVESEQRPTTIGFDRDPILEGDVIEFVPEKRPFPAANQLNLDTGTNMNEPGRRIRMSRPDYDPTRAGVRTDVQAEFRPCFRRVPIPASYHQEQPASPRRPPRSHLWRSRDIITQQDAEFVPAPSSSIKTFPAHLRSGISREPAPYRPSKRLLRPSESETALRTMHYCMPSEEGESQATAIKRSDKNMTTGGDVINYRFSGGICPSSRTLDTTRQVEHEMYERQLQDSHRTDVVHVHQLFRNNVERARRLTSIF